MHSRLLEEISDDLNFLSGSSSVARRAFVFFFRPAFRVLFWYRLAHHFRKKGFTAVYHYAMFRMSKFGCYINPDALLGRRVKFPHPVGIVIGKGAAIADECTIFQNVTIGGSGKSDAYPNIRNNVKVFAGAVIIGGCTIGENAVIGANSVVLKDVPAGMTFKGTPAQCER